MPNCSLLFRLWNQDQGVLSFEWIVLVTLLTIGVVSGIAGGRDALCDEMGDSAQAIVSLDQTFTIDFPLVLTMDGVSTGSASNSSFVDAVIYEDCDRPIVPVGQAAEIDQ